MRREPTPVRTGTMTLGGDTWASSGPPVVLLHAGVADSRGWYPLADRLSRFVFVTAYDRPGYGHTPPASGPPATCTIWSRCWTRWPEARRG